MAWAWTATIRRSRGRSFIRCAKPWPSSLPSRFSAGSFTSSKNSSDVSAASMPSFLSLRPRRKPAPLLLLGAVMQDVGRDDAGMQRRAEGVEAGEAELAVDHRLVREGPTGAAVLLGDGGAKEPRRPSLGPHLAAVDAGLVPG